MKIVFDTNVLIAAFITKGVCSDLMEHCVRSHDLATSKFNYTVEEVREAVELSRFAMQVVLPAFLEEPVSRDPNDDMVLGTATAAGAACIITGDKDLLVLENYRGVDIIAPAQFARYEESKSETP